MRFGTCVGEENGLWPDLNAAPLQVGTDGLVVDPELPGEGFEGGTGLVGRDEGVDFRWLQFVVGTTGDCRTSGFGT